MSRRSGTPGPAMPAPATGGGNFATHKFTTDETWNAVLGLSGATKVEIIIDASLVTGGSMALDIDGSEVETFAGTGFATINY